MFEIDAGSQVSDLIGMVTEHIEREVPVIAKALSDVQLAIGLADDNKYGVPSHAVYQPVTMGVGDAKAWKGDLLGMTSELEALSKSNPGSVGILPEYNPSKNRYDFKIVKKGVGDSDAIYNGQVLSPWNVSFFTEIAKKPLSYSSADRHVKRYAGTNPWAIAMTLLLQDYAGAASIGNAGSVSSNLNQDVQIKAGAMTSAIINAICSYSITIEELQKSRAVQGNPLAGKMIPSKEMYVDYCLKLIRDVLIYYGNSSSDTIGLLGVNSITSWGGTSLTDISNDGSNTSKGSTAYQVLAAAVRSFIGAVDNKFNVINMAMSPVAYNLLATMNYSDVYNPEPALNVIKRNLESSMTEDGRDLKINIFPDPLLKASSVFNSNAYDYLVLTAPEITAGPNEEQQDLLFFGEPIEDFTFPVIPGQYHTQYKKLKRMAGVFAPVPAAVKVYSGFGVD